MKADRSPLQDHSFTKTLLYLGIVAIVINLDRILLGENCPIRRIDVTDVYLAKFQYLGQFWRQPFDFAWNAASFRGWPSYLESVQPQHLCSLLSSFLPATLSFTIFQVLVDALTLIGTFMFFYNFLGFRYATALYASLFNLAMIYWFNENPFVTQVAFVPLIVAVTSIGKRPIGTHLRLVFLILSFLMTFPPYNVPLSPIVHLACVYFLSEKSRRKLNVQLAALVWAVFTVFYFPNLLGYLLHWDQSNRTLWHIEAAPFSWGSLIAHLRHMDFWFPPICVVAMFSFWKRWKTMALVAAILVVLFIISQSGFWLGFPILKATAFAWGRLYYFISFFFVLWIAYVIEKNPREVNSKNILINTAKALVCAAIGFACLKTQPSLVGRTFFVLGMMSSLYLQFNVLKFATSGIKFVGLAALFLYPFHFFYIFFYSQPHYALLKHDPFVYKNSFEPFRVVSVSETCFTHTFYHAQAAIKGLETFDGASVFYDKDDAANWYQYVTKDADYCTFYTWNNNLYMGSAIWEAHPDRVLKWLRLNNVAFIRAEVPLKNKGIVLDQEKTISATWWRLNLKKVKPAYWTWQLYRIKDPLSRVVAAPRKSLLDEGGQMLADNAIFDALENIPLRNIGLDSYVPSRLEWHGTFDDQELLVSTNYDKNWQLWVDQKPVDLLQPGPFGMLRVPGLKGEHTYVLRYSDNSFLYMVMAMIVGLWLLFMYVHYLARFEKNLWMRAKKS